MFVDVKDFCPDLGVAEAQQSTLLETLQVDPQFPHCATLSFWQADG